MHNRVLVVDDKSDVRELLEGLIHFVDNSIIVECAHNGGAAVSAMRRNEYNLVFIDYRMPKMNGVEAVRRIREFDQDTPIYMHTSENEEVIRAAIPEGINGYVQKSAPDRKQHVREIVRKHVLGEG